MKGAFWPALVVSALVAGCRGPSGPEGAGFESLSDGSIQPKIIFSDPPAGATGPFDSYNQIQLRFNKYMDLHSLRRAIRFASPLDDMVADTNGILSANGDIITVSARPSTGSTFYWHIGETYTLSISDEAEDVNGNRLRSPFSMTILPEPNFRVRTVSPRNGANNVSLKARLTLGFNSPVTPSIFQAVSISPPVAGSWSFPSPVLVAYRPTVSLDVQTEYTITLTDSAADEFKNVLPGTYSWKFTTVPFRVSTVSPANGSLGVSLFGQASFSLNVAADSSTVRRAFSIQPPISGTLSYGGTKIKFTPAAAWLPQTTYKISISTDLKTATGKNLLQPFVLTFTTLD